MMYPYHIGCNIYTNICGSIVIQMVYNYKHEKVNIINCN